ncbi:S66 family peptidase [Acinetobacter rathckeae]|uniref:S66 family peptidase n=1 Tax=Acinetobacter rathckeae TaxID=2605272 RepID=UPI001D1852B7|nr:S66 peptidase family protein [Acinetobacter rathckeae]
MIAITAPSMGVPNNFHARLDYVIKHLKAKGFRVTEGQCLRAVHKNVSNNRLTRAKELNGFLLHSEVKAIMPPWGGELAMDILELIDFKQLSKCEPKWFCGYSDLSTLHMPLTTLAGWATLHSPNLMEFSITAPDDTTEKIWNILQANRGAIVHQSSSLHYQTKPNNWALNPSGGFSLTVPTQWKRLDGESSPISFQGRLIGGCLETISRLAGTEFGDIPQFVKQHATTGTILYFESSELRPCALARALLSLKMQYWFNDLSGILVGRSSTKEQEKGSTDQLSYVDALKLALGHLNIPIIYDVDIGHVPPQVSLVNGVIAQVNFSQIDCFISQQL